MRLRCYEHMQWMEENNEMIAIADMIVPGKKDQGETKREMDGLRPKGYAGTVDHPGWCPGQHILEIKNSGRWPHLVGKGEEEKDTGTIWNGIQMLGIWCLIYSQGSHLCQQYFY